MVTRLVTIVTKLVTMVTTLVTKVTKSQVNRRFELLMHYLSMAECIKSKTCSFKEMNYDCPLDKVCVYY